MSGFIPRIWISLCRPKPQERTNFSLPKKTMETAPGRFPKKVPPSIEKACFTLAGNQLRIQIKLSDFPAYPLNLQVEVELIINQKEKCVLFSGGLDLSRQGQSAELDKTISINLSALRGQSIRSASEINISLIEPFAHGEAEICNASFIKEDGEWS